MNFAFHLMAIIKLFQSYLSTKYLMNKKVTKKNMPNSFQNIQSEAIA